MGFRRNRKEFSICTVSNIGDDYRDKFPIKWPNIYPNVGGGVTFDHITRSEFEALKKEVSELKKLLEAAKKYDEETGQKDCHMDEKVEFIKKIAEFVGVDLGDVFENAK